MYENLFFKSKKSSTAPYKGAVTNFLSGNYPSQLSKKQQLIGGVPQKKALPDPLLVGGYANEMGIFMPFRKINFK